MIANLSTQKMNSTFGFRFMRKVCLTFNNKNVINVDQSLWHRQLSGLFRHPEELLIAPFRTPRILRLHHKFLHGRQVHQNANIREANESSETPLLVVVKEVFSLKDRGATSLVVEVRRIHITYPRPT